jgi:prephenate dehydrogenase
MSDHADFGTVTIVGVGLLGGSIGRALLKSNSASRIVGVGRSTERLAQAADLGAITEYTTDLSQAAANSDIIILCTPVGAIIRDLPEVLSIAGPNCTVTDVGSIKGAICEAAGDDPRFIGGHPMAGSEQAGVIASRPDLFQDATWALTPSEKTGVEHFQKVQSLAHQLGAATIVLSTAQHDRAVAVTSHLPHAMATSLMRVANARKESAPEILRLTAGSFADATRVAASSPELWSNIFQFNRDALIEVLLEFRSEIDAFVFEITENDTKELRDRFAAGAAAKQSWSKQD